MAIIDLCKRNTQNWENMHQHLRSPDSLIFIDPMTQGHDCLVSLDLEVGDAYIIPGSNESFKILEDGIKVKPKQAIVVYTRQNFKLPYNVFGVVTGKGKYIFKGCFLSTGKIDPGFEGHLKIGFFNGGCSSIILRTSDVFATVYFLNTDTTLTSPLKNYQSSLDHDVHGITWHEKAWIYVQGHWLGFVAWLIAFIPASLYYISQLIEYFTNDSH